jgi:signal peptidase II
MIFKNLSKIFNLNSLVVSLIFFLDRFSKEYVIYLTENNYEPLFSSSFLNINLIWNDGIAFGFFSFNEKYFYTILTIVIFLVILVILTMLVKSRGIKKYSLLMILGGALGNFYDRVVFFAVPDFIDFHIKTFHWFIFNVADIFITLGVIIIIMTEFIDIKKN